MNPEYKIREQKDIKLITNTENEYNLTKLIKQEYPYILQAMKHEKYKIEYEKYDILQEIIHDNKVIGFISLEKKEQPITTLCINETYILPEYRHKGLFHETLLNILCQPNMTIAIKNPNRQIIDKLIKYKLAKKLENNLVLSYIDFYIDDTQIYTNKQIVTQYDKNYIKNEEVPTDFYDLNINSCVFMEVNNLKDNTQNKVFIVKARQTDIQEEKYYRLLKNIDNIYMENLKERIFYINNEDLKFLHNVQEMLDEYININEILGTEEELTPLFKEKLKEKNLTIKDGYIIRSKVLKALEKDEIIPKSLIIRTIYLLEHYENNNNIITNQIPHTKHIDECPYCSSTYYANQEVCSNCGYNLLHIHKNVDNFLEVLTNKILEHKLPENLLLKKHKNKNQNNIMEIMENELNYMNYKPEEVYDTQNIISTYQLLKSLNDLIYFEIYNYDLLNHIQEGSAFQYAKENELIEDLKDYQYYLRLMEECYPEKNLKKILEENNYSTKGQKQDLIHRIERNINPKNIFGQKYSLTNKGEEFILNKDYIENYLENLSEFTFYEYKKFYEENKQKSYDQLNMDFIKHMKEIALETNNYYKYHDYIRHMINSNDNGDLEYFLTLFTQLFIIDINQWINSLEHRKTSKPLSDNVMHEYPEIKKYYFQNDTDKIFNKAMNLIELNELKTNNDLVRFYLEKSLEYEDIDDINREIEYNIFEEEYLRKFKI